MRWSFSVDGQPATKGSYRAIVTKGRTLAGKPKAIAKNDNPRCKRWETSVGWAAKTARPKVPIASGSVRLHVCFEIDRTAQTRDAALPVQDIDKLLRALLDGMTGIVYEDDRQVVRVEVEKCWTYGGGPGVTVHVDEDIEPARPGRSE